MQASDGGKLTADDDVCDDDDGCRRSLTAAGKWQQQLLLSTTTMMMLLPTAAAANVANGSKAVGANAGAVQRAAKRLAGAGWGRAPSGSDGGGDAGRRPDGRAGPDSNTGNEQPTINNR